MAGGYKFSNEPQEVLREYYKVGTEERLSSGANLMNDGLGYVMTCAPLNVDFEKREATLCFRARVASLDKSGDTTIKYGCGIKSGMFISDGKTDFEVKDVKVSGDNYTIVGCKFAVDAIIFEVKNTGVKTPKDTPNALNYGVTPCDKGESVSVLIRAYEIKNNKLYSPLLPSDIEALGGNMGRYFFLNRK